MEDKKQEDMDMLYVFKSIQNGLISLVKFVTWLFDFFFKNIVTFLVFFFVTTSISLGFYYFKKPYYTSTLSISHIRVENDYCSQIIRSLNLYCEASDNAGLAKQLSIDPNSAAKIKSLKYFPLNENIAKRFADSVSVMIPFKIEVEVYSLGILDTLQSALLTYLESNKYALKRKEIDSAALVRTELKVRTETQQIDSLKQIVGRSIIPRSTGTGIILGEPVDPVAIYKAAMESHEKLLLVNKKQQLNNSFELMVGFADSSKRSDLSMLAHIFLGMSAGYIIAMIWLLKRKYGNINNSTN